MELTRREFLTFVGKAAALAAIPLPISAITEFDDLIHLKSIVDTKGKYDWKLMFRFSRSGYQDISKGIIIGSTTDFTDSRQTRHELAYRLTKVFREVNRDYLYLQHGKNWRTYENQDKWMDNLTVIGNEFQELNVYNAYPFIT